LVGLSCNYGWLRLKAGQPEVVLAGQAIHPMGLLFFGTSNVEHRTSNVE
jgi:hypothetical protein